MTKSNRNGGLVDWDVLAERWEPFLRESDRWSPQLAERFLDIMKASNKKRLEPPPWQAEDLVEVWESGPKIGVVVKRKWLPNDRQLFDGQWIYEVLIDGTVKIYKPSRLFAIGESRKPNFAESFPIIKNSKQRLIPNELVKVQPMTMPSGLIFYLDSTYGDSTDDDEEQTGTDESSAGRGARAVQAEEPGLWGRLRRLWTRRRSRSSG